MSWNYCRTCGFADCPSIAEGGGCPRWPARGTPEPAGMFAHLTPLERETLAVKLQRAGHAFYESADAIGATALYLRETGRITTSSGEWDGLWDIRKPLVAAIDEMHALTAEVDAE